MAGTNTTRVFITYSGVTHAGGNNLSYASYQEAADYWIETFGSHVQGARTIDDFADGLQKAHYNTKNAFYYIELKEQLTTVRKFKAECGVP